VFVVSGKRLDNDSLGMTVSDSVCTDRSVGVSWVGTLFLIQIHFSTHFLPCCCAVLWLAWASCSHTYATVTWLCKLMYSQRSVAGIIIMGLVESNGFVYS